MFVVGLCRVGPVVRFWTMRFEGCHKLFKHLSAMIGNFINIPKTLAHRYQEYQCYHFMTILERRQQLAEVSKMIIMILIS